VEYPWSARFILDAVNYAQLLFPDFSLIAIGWLLCRYTALDRRVWDQVESLVYYFLFPVLLFHSIVRSPLDFGATSNLLTAGLCVGACGIAMAYALPFMFRASFAHRPARPCGQHAGRVPLQLVHLPRAGGAAGGPEGLLLIAVLIGVCVPIFNIAAVWPMTRHAQTGFVRQLVRNPLIVATVAGLLANVLGFTVPNWATPTLTRIGAASLALGLLAAGAGMKFSTLGTGKTLAVSVLAIRHLFLPLIAWGLVHALRLDATQGSVLMAFSAVPTASSAYVLAARMGYNGPYVAGLVTLSTLLGVVSLPFALALPR
jgi:malonate transporter